MFTIQSFTFNPFQENTYLLANEKGNAFIIDPGMYFSAEKERMENELLRAGFSIKKIINTHCHIDHIFSIEWTHKKYNVDIAIHADEQILLTNSKATAEGYGLSIEPFSGEISFFKEGDKIMLDDDELIVIEAPGHSPGGVCFYCEKQQFLIAGDVLFKESIGRSDLPGGDGELLIKNIHEKLFTLSDDVVVYPGHGPSTTIGYEKKNNPFLKQ